MTYTIRQLCNHGHQPLSQQPRRLTPCQPLLTSVNSTPTPTTILCSGIFYLKSVNHFAPMINCEHFIYVSCSRSTCIAVMCCILIIRNRIIIQCCQKLKILYPIILGLNFELENCPVVQVRHTSHLLP